MPRKTKLKLVTTRASPDAHLPRAPEHLGVDGMRLWRDVQREYAITDPAGLELLRQAAECTDRITSVRKQIDEHGEMLTIRGIPRVNPLCAVERDQRAALVRCLRNLNLDLEPLRDHRGRPGGAGVGWTA
jgi:phage terminase small subunit